jgi:hypothetical protein
MRAVAADPVRAEEAKGSLVVRGSLAARADWQFEVRLASSGEDINVGMARSQVVHHRLVKLHAQQW